MKTILLILSIFSTQLIFAEDHHSLGAHEHGTIKVGMAVEKNTVEINIDGPAESFLGFEYIPMTAKEKKLLSSLENQWNKNIYQLIAFDKSLNCKIIESSFKQVIDQKETDEAQAKIKDAHKKEKGVHSDIEAKAKLNCGGNLVGTNVVISLKKAFSHIKKLTVEVLSSETKRVEITLPVQTFKI